MTHSIFPCRRLRTALSRCAALALLLATTAACTQDDLSAPDNRGGIRVSVSCGSLTRGTMAGVDALNENALTEAWVFLFPAGTVTADNASAQATLAQKVSLNAAGTAVFTITPQQEEVENTLFPNQATEADIYVVANLPATTAADFSTLPTLSQLRQLAVEAQFKGSDPGETVSTGNYKTQDSFVMTGSGSVTLDRSTQPYSGSASVNLKRLASKVELSIHIAQSIKGDDGRVWTPDYDHIDVRLMGCKQKAQLSGEPWEPVPAVPLAGLEGTLLETARADNAIFDYYRRYGTAQTIDQQSRSSVGPFYSYPTAWPAADPFGPAAVYALITVPMSEQNQQTGSIKYEYYRYKVRMLWSQLEPNKWYTQRVNIELLGALHQGEEVPELTDLTFAVADWSTVENSVQITDMRQLDVTYAGDVTQETTSQYNADFFGSPATDTGQHHVVILDNLEDVNITYTSSPGIKLQSVEKYYYDFSGNQATRVAAAADGAGTVSALTGAGTEANPWTANYSAPKGTTGDRPVTVWLEGSGSQTSIHVHHSLHNRTSDTATDYDVSAFYLRLHITHDDQPATTTAAGESEYIYIVQRPAISIRAEYTGDTYGTSGACVSVNKGQGSIGTNGTDEGQNTNFNQYVITISKLNSRSEYILADPRVDRENASSYWTNATTAKYISGHNSDGTPIISTDTRKLRYYRPTKGEGLTGTDLDNVKKLIAPSFRIASSHGATIEISQANARYRCATYQENGCPAGRWRVPTVAEIKFVMGLSAIGKMPYLFGQDKEQIQYWVATGLVEIDRTGTTTTVNEVTNVSGSHPVRAVYDEWYWTDKLTADQKKTFTWGDMQ